MMAYIAEFIGTFLLILLGDSVVANVTLDKSGMKGGRLHPDYAGVGTCRYGSRIYFWSRFWGAFQPGADSGIGCGRKPCLVYGSGLCDRPVCRRILRRMRGI